MEMVKQYNRRLLSAKVEQLEQEVTHLQHALADKQQQEKAMLQVLMHMEQEQKVTEDARFAVEREDTAQLYQEKYEKVVLELDQMEERVAMAESMLEYIGVMTRCFDQSLLYLNTSCGSVQPLNTVTKSIRFVYQVF